jgi:6-phosphogluconolactonase
MNLAANQRLAQTKGGAPLKAANVKPNVAIVDNSQELAHGALELFVSDAQKAIGARECFCAAISRHMPRCFFELLGEQSRSKALPWEKIHLFWVDECCGPTNLKNKNYNLAARTFISKVGIPVENVHRICSENRNCGYVASIYEQTIHKVIKLKRNGIPQFDLIVLGMGADGHVASLFPDTYAFFDTKALVRVIYFMDGRYTRITVTNSVLRAASHITVLVCGEEKAAVLREVLTGERDEVRYPLHAIWPILDKVTWLVDHNAAKFLLQRRRPNKSVRRSLQPLEPYERL